MSDKKIDGIGVRAKDYTIAKLLEENRRLMDVIASLEAKIQCKKCTHELSPTPIVDIPKTPDWLDYTE